MIKEIIPCFSIGMGPEPAVLKSDWSIVGLRLCIFSYEDKSPISCCFTDSNALKNENSSKTIFLGDLHKNVRKL